MNESIYGVHVYICVCVCVYIYIYTHTLIDIYIHIHTMEYYSAIKKKEILPFAATQMDIEGIM